VYFGHVYALKVMMRARYLQDKSCFSKAVWSEYPYMVYRDDSIDTWLWLLWETRLQRGTTNNNCLLLNVSDGRWAARYNTWLLIELTPFGVLFLSNELGTSSGLNKLSSGCQHQDSADRVRCCPVYYIVEILVKLQDWSISKRLFATSQSLRLPIRQAPCASLLKCVLTFHHEVCTLAATARSSLSLLDPVQFAFTCSNERHVQLWCDSLHVYKHVCRDWTTATLVIYFLTYWCIYI